MQEWITVLASDPLGWFKKDDRPPTAHPAVPDVKVAKTLRRRKKKMSAELHPGARIQSIKVGGSKPLHHFMKGQPKITGSAVLVVGSSFFIVSVMAVKDGGPSMWPVFPHSVTLGILFIICGILYIVTEYHTTKKTVTISLALTIVTILGIFWAILQIIPNVHYSHHYYNFHEYDEDNVTDTATTWSHYHQAMAMAIEFLYLFYFFVSAVVLIVMSALASIALRSKTQAIVLMTTVPIEMPVE